MSPFNGAENIGLDWKDRKICEMLSNIKVHFVTINERLLYWRECTTPVEGGIVKLCSDKFET